jgi:hypothetical protein
MYFFISAHFYWISREYTKFDRLKRKKRHFLNFKIRKKIEKKSKKNQILATVNLRQLTSTNVN